MSEVSSSGFYADFGKLTELKGQSRQNSPEAIHAAAQQFEALFIQMLLKNMRDSSLVDGESLFDSDEGKMYHEMFDRQVSLDMAKKSQIGIADMLVRQLTPADQNDSAASEAASGATLSAIKRYQGVSPSGAAISGRADSGEPFAATPDEFVSRLWPHAERAAQKIGVEPEVLVAQAALETGWGQSLVSDSRGGSSLNLFNIKASANWRGGVASSLTTEFHDGVPTKRNESFRVYQTAGESFDDYAALIAGSERYRGAVANASDNAAYLRGLQDAGYATDPRYADKVQEILDRDSFKQAIARFKDLSV